MNDEVNDDMIAIPATEDDDVDEEALTPQERLIRGINDATADAFTQLSYFIRGIRDELPPPLRPAFREIVGAAMKAHAAVIFDSLSDDNRNFLDAMAECLTERALAAIKGLDDSTADADTN